MKSNYHGFTPLEVRRQRRLSLRQRRAELLTGFTLLELVLVVIILATLATLVVPVFGSFWPGYQVDQCARQILALARLARNNAASEHLRYQLNIDTTENTYRLMAESNPFTEPGVFEELGTTWGREYSLPKDIVFSEVNTPMAYTRVGEGLNIITFYPDGSADDAVITIASVRKGTPENNRDIMIQSMTGQVKILPRTEEINR